VALAPSPAAKQWSRPFRIDVCSVFARMPRYGAAGRGTHVTLPRRVAVQLRTSQHSCDSSFQKTFSEHRTLNPRVRGSSPRRRTRSDLGFHDSRSLFMCPFCPHVCSMLARPHGPSNPGHVKNGPSGRRGAAPRSLDQWSRPHAQGPGGTRSPYSNAVTLSATCWSVALMADTSLPRRPERAGCLPGMPGDGGDARPGGGADCRRTFEALIRWALPSVRGPGRC
jgi:hypothetical protein